MEKRRNQVVTRQQSGETAKPYIISIRGLRVIMDTDLAALYGVKTKRLKE